MSEDKRQYEVAVAGQHDSGFMALVKSLAENPDVDVSKIQQIVDMQEHILDRNAQQAFNASMVQAQREMPIVPRDKKNGQTNSMYSKYETILKHCKPVYTKYGFSVMFHEGEAKQDGDIRIVAEVMHEQGHTKTVWTDIPLDNVGIKGSINKTNTHAKGSSITYGRGYLIKEIFNIPTGDDDDGNTAGFKGVTEEQINEIHALIVDNLGQVYLPTFLKYCRLDTLDDIPAKDFKKRIAEVKTVISKANKGQK